MRRLARREACLALGITPSTFAERCRFGYFLSARQDQPRAGWSVAECCVLAEQRTEWPCGACSGDHVVQPLRWEVQSVSGSNVVIVEGQKTSPVENDEVAHALLAMASELRMTAENMERRARDLLASSAKTREADSAAA